MTRVLVVEDDPQLVRALVINLQARQYGVDAAPDGATALRLAAARQPDVVMLDLGLPDMDGVDVIKALRGWTRVPILVLSARQASDEKVAALDAGADDYITKPFSQRLLIERIRALLRRNEASKAEGSGAAPGGVMVRGDLILDETKHQCTWRGHDIQLTVTEFLLVKALAARPGMVKSRDQLIDAAYGENI
jgi:DNA-binding response OmpR family regulator